MSSSDKASKSLKTALTASYAAVYRPGRVFIAYALIASFWFAFGQIYEYFGHGVTTPFMHLAFLIPLCMGLVPAVIFLITGKKIAPGRFSRSFWRWACACFTGGSVLKGVFFIYGTDSRYPAVYLIAGIVFAILGAAAYVYELV